MTQGSLCAELVGVKDEDIMLSSGTDIICV